jgi:HAD superfamily hydrolase (TIGR01549 family)
MYGKIVLVDLDKTIIDMNDQLVESMSRLLALLGKKVHRQMLERTTNLYGYLASLGIMADNLDFWRRFNEIDNRMEGISKKLVRLFPDSIEFLEVVSGYKSAVVSDTPWCKAEPEITFFNLAKYFNVFSHWDESKLGRGKPDPLLAIEAIEKLGYEGEKIYFVGDDLADIKCAQNLEAYLNSEKNLSVRITKIHVKRSGLCLHGADITVPSLGYAADIIKYD